jgi:hypothetical protein
VKKVAKNMSFLKTLPKGNNCPTGKNSPNLVALIGNKMFAPNFVDFTNQYFYQNLLEKSSANIYP